MSEIQKESVEKEQNNSMELLYIKYFNKMLARIDEYHRTGYSWAASNVIVDPQNENKSDILEITIREALGLNRSLSERSLEITPNQIDKIRSVLANLVKMNDREKLKKAVLMTFRRYIIIEGLSSIQNSRLDILKSAVANAAVVNGLATSADYYHLIVGDSKKQYMNDLIAQAKLDIKAEMAQTVPLYNEIHKICGRVVNAAKHINMPDATIQMLNKEFDADAIIAGGNHVAKFEKTIEMKRADQDILEATASWVDIVSKENDELKKENKQIKENMKKLLSLADNMHASLFSRGVNRYKDKIWEMEKSMKLLSR